MLSVAQVHTFSIARISRADSALEYASLATLTFLISAAFAFERGFVTKSSASIAQHYILRRPSSEKDIPRREGVGRHVTRPIWMCYCRPRSPVGTIRIGEIRGRTRHGAKDRLDPACIDRSLRIGRLFTQCRCADTLSVR